MTEENLLKSGETDNPWNRAKSAIMRWLSTWRILQMKMYVWFKYDLGQKYQAPQVRPDWGSNSWPPDHDSTFLVTEMPDVTTRPSVTSTSLGRPQGKRWKIVLCYSLNLMIHFISVKYLLMLCAWIMSGI